MARTEAFPGYVCPSCGVLVLSEAALAEAPGEDPVCVICAPYDPEREGIALLLLNDALEEMLHRRPQIGAVERRGPSRTAFTNVVFEARELEAGIVLNEFIEELLRAYYEDAFPGSARARFRDAAIGAVRKVKEKLEKHSGEERRVAPVILPSTEGDQYIAVLQHLHDNYVAAHRRFIESRPDLEAARIESYGQFWHIGSLIRTGRMATRPSPWVTGEERPRF